MSNKKSYFAREKGFAYCGLACCICSENENCLGCRNDGCTDKQGCQSYDCCKEKGLNGCWECSDFPCNNPMLNKLRVRTFAKFISMYGENELLKCLKINESKGIIYHYEGKLVGDYDNAQTEEEIVRLIRYGIK